MLTVGHTDGRTVGLMDGQTDGLADDALHDIVYLSGIPK